MPLLVCWSGGSRSVREALRMRRLRYRKIVSQVMLILTALCALVAIATLIIILSYIIVGGLRSISWDFLVNNPKPIGEPVGIFAGLYLAEFGQNKLGFALRFFIDTLIGVPSIVIGVFVWTVMVRPMGHFSAWAGATALGIMMMPIVARTTEEMIRLVPQSLREAALALGAPVWRVSLGVVLRAAAPGVATGAMLAIARVAGETAPLLFTALALNYMSTDLNQPMASLTFQIYYYAGSPYDEWHAQAWAATLVLMTLILSINIAVRFLTRKKF